MAHIIKTSTPGKERERLSKSIIVTIRDFMRQQEPTDTTNDMVAFIILALREISMGIEQSVLAWEKRGYWVKADKYRLEWQWSGEMSAKLQSKFDDKDWENISGDLLTVMAKFSNIKVSDRHRLGKPYQNAYETFHDMVN